MPQADLAAELETVRALFDPRRLTQARQLTGLLKADLAERLDISAAAIGQFEGGVARPSGLTIQKLALALGFPVQFFAANRSFPQPEDDPHFRSLRSTTKRERARALAQVEVVAELVTVIERAVRLPAVDLPELHPRTSPEDAARAIRAEWKLGNGPIASVVGLLERRGVIVCRLPAATDDLDAFSCVIGARPFVILVSNKEAADRARFDAAHELAHLLLHHDAKPGDPDVEREAHRFAAEFLTPEQSIRRVLPRRLDWRALATLKMQWGVSMAMLLRRMRDLNVISDATFGRGMMDLSRRGWRKAEPVDLGAPEEPELLARALHLLRTQRSFGLDDLARELAMRPENVQPFAEAIVAEGRAELAL